MDGSESYFGGKMARLVMVWLQEMKESPAAIFFPGFRNTAYSDFFRNSQVL